MQRLPMLLVVLSLWGILPAGAAAQTDSSDVIKDTLDWRGYYPLEVGNTWEYATSGSNDSEYERREITGDTLLDGTSYFVHWTRRYDANKQPVEQVVDYLRYDTIRTTVVAHAAGDSYPAWQTADSLEQPWAGPVPIYTEVVTCDMTVDFGSQFNCEEDGEDWTVRAYGEYRHLTYGMIDSKAEKEFSVEGSGIGVMFFHGVGQYIGSYTYLKIGDKEWGESVVLDVDRPRARAAQPRILSVYPSPFRERATVVYQAPEGSDIIVTVSDALGRVVHRQTVRTLQSGTHRYSLGGQELAAGLYFIQITDSSSGKEDVRRIVLLR